MLRIRFCMLIIAAATAAAGGAAGARAAGAGIPPTEWMRSAGDQSLLERVVSKRCLIAPDSPPSNGGSRRDRRTH
jgi:hypothetical protein